MIPKLSSIKRPRASGGGGSSSSSSGGGGSSSQFGRKERSRGSHTVLKSDKFPEDVISEVESHKTARLLGTGDLLYSTADNALKCCWWNNMLQIPDYCIDDCGSMDSDASILTNFADILERTVKDGLNCKAKVVFTGTPDGTIRFYDLYYKMSCELQNEAMKYDGDSLTCLSHVGDGFIVLGTKAGNLYYMQIPDTDPDDAGDIVDDSDDSQLGSALPWYQKLVHSGATKIAESRGLISSLLSMFSSKTSSCPGTVKRVLYYPNNESVLAWSTSSSGGNYLTAWTSWKVGNNMHKTSEINLDRVVDSLDVGKIGIERVPDRKIVLDVAVISIPDQNYDTVTLAVLGLVAENAPDMDFNNHLVLFLLEVKLNLGSSISSAFNQFSVKTIAMVAKNVMYGADDTSNPRIRVVKCNNNIRGELSRGDLFVLWGDASTGRDVHTILVSIKNMGSALLQDHVDKFKLVRNSFHIDNIRSDKIYSDNILDGENPVLKFFTQNSRVLQSYRCIPNCEFVTDIEDNRENLFIFILNMMGADQLDYKEISKYVIDDLKSLNASETLIRVVRKICDGDINAPVNTEGYYGSEFDKTFKLLNNSPWKVSKRFELLAELVRVVNVLVESQFLPNFPDSLFVFIESITCCYELRKAIVSSVTRRDKFLATPVREEVLLLTSSAAAATSTITASSPAAAAAAAVVVVDVAATDMIDLTADRGFASTTQQQLEPRLPNYADDSSGSFFEENSIIETVKVISETIELYCEQESVLFFDNVPRSVAEIKSMGLAPDDLYYGKCSAISNMIHYFKVNYEQRPGDSSSRVYSLYGVLFLLLDVLIKTKDYAVVSTMTVNEAESSFRLIHFEKIRHAILFFGEELWIGLRDRRQRGKKDAILFDESCFRNIRGFLICLHKWSLGRRALNHVNHEDFSKALEIFVGLVMEMGFSSEHLVELSVEFQYKQGFFLSYFREYPEDLISSSSLNASCLNEICENINNLLASRLSVISEFAESMAEYVITWLMKFEEKHNLSEPLYPNHYLNLISKCRGGADNPVVKACETRYPSVGYHGCVKKDLKSAAKFAFAIFRNKRVPPTDKQAELWLSLGQLALICDADEEKMNLNNMNQQSSSTPSEGAAPEEVISVSNQLSVSDFKKRLALLNIKKNFEAYFGSPVGTFPDCISGPSFYDNLKDACDFMLRSLIKVVASDSEINVALGEKKSELYAWPLTNCLALVAMMKAESRGAIDGYAETCEEDIDKALEAIWKLSILSQHELWLNIISLTDECDNNPYVEYTIFYQLLLNVRRDSVEIHNMLSRQETFNEGDFITMDLAPITEQKVGSPQLPTWCLELFASIDSSSYFEGKVISDVLKELIDYMLY